MGIRIRITGQGIHGKPTDENPTGEYPVGHEFDTEAEFPEGWKGRAEIVGKGAKEGSTAITNPADPLVGSIDALKAHLATVTDPDEVQKLIDAEKAGKNRNGGIALLEARRDELLAA